MLFYRWSKNKELVSLLFCVLFSLSSLFWNSNFLVRGIASFQKLGNFFSSSLDNFGDFVKSIYTKIESFESVRQERDSCLAVMEDYKLLPQDLEKLKQENDVLKKEVGFRPNVPIPSIKAEIYSLRLHSIFRTIVISKGSLDGIKPHMPVIARAVLNNGEIGQAVVGKVIAVNEETSIVEPLINSNFKMGVSIPGINFWAILSGNSGRGVDAILTYIDQGMILDPRVFESYKGPEKYNDKEFSSVSNIGKWVFSSGGDGIYPKGIPVGEIIEEGDRVGSFKTAYLRPFVRFENLKNLTVLLKTPDKWILEWPQEKNIQIENPFFGKATFPGEEKKIVPQVPVKNTPKEPEAENTAQEEVLQ